MFALIVARPEDAADVRRRRARSRRLNALLGRKANQSLPRQDLQDLQDPRRGEGTKQRRYKRRDLHEPRGKIVLETIKVLKHKLLHEHVDYIEAEH